MPEFIFDPLKRRQYFSFIWNITLLGNDFATWIRFNLIGQILQNTNESIHIARVNLIWGRLNSILGLHQHACLIQWQSCPNLPELLLCLRQFQHLIPSLKPIFPSIYPSERMPHTTVTVSVIMIVVPFIENVRRCGRMCFLTTLLQFSKPTKQIVNGADLWFVLRF